jgi:hypothetical protein
MSSTFWHRNTRKANEALAFLVLLLGTPRMLACGNVDSSCRIWKPQWETNPVKALEPSAVAEDEPRVERPTKDLGLLGMILC